MFSLKLYIAKAHGTKFKSSCITTSIDSDIQADAFGLSSCFRPFWIYGLLLSSQGFLLFGSANILFRMSGLQYLRALVQFIALSRPWALLFAFSRWLLIESVTFF